MTRIIGLAVATIGLAASLTACGGSDDGESNFADSSAQDIVDASKDAMKELDAVKVSGSISTGDQDITLDIETNSDGDCVGSIGLGGADAELLGVDGDTWFRPSDEFWQQNSPDQADQIMAIVGDKWVVVPAGDEGFAQFCDLDELLDQVLADDDEDGEATFTKGDTSKIEGDGVIAVDRKDDKGTSTGYVLLDEPNYLVKIDKTDGDSTGTVTFSEFDQEFSAEAPPADDIIDLDNLAG